jgi:hypothetical protein
MLTNELIADIKTPQTKYLIIFEDDMEEPIILNIDENINRPNCPDDDEIIKDYIEFNYGGTSYNSIRIDDLKTFRIR